MKLSRYKRTPVAVEGEMLIFKIVKVNQIRLSTILTNNQVLRARHSMFLPDTKRDKEQFRIAKRYGKQVRISEQSFRDILAETN